VNKDDVAMNETIADMKSMMYTILGMIFGTLWLLAAVFLPAFPSGWLQLIYGIVVAFFGCFLIFIPHSTYLGLYFVALGAFFIYISHHDGRYDDHTAAAVGCVVGFLIISGLTFVAFGSGDWVSTTTPTQCYTDLGYDMPANAPVNLYGYPTRCENYLLFVLFCIYMLLLLMPFGKMLAWYSARAGAVVPAGSPTNVVSVPSEVQQNN